MLRHVKIAFTNKTGIHFRFVSYDTDKDRRFKAEKLIAKKCKQLKYPSPVFMVERASGAFCYIPVY